ncbi:MAG: hypothetical protein PHC75_05480 [Burkholderiales bacterium]|nr:hypothetical protein [Burkholderiales bacterium]
MKKLIIATSILGALLAACNSGSSSSGSYLPAGNYAVTTSGDLGPCAVAFGELFGTVANSNGQGAISFSFESYSQFQSNINLANNPCLSENREGNTITLNNCSFNSSSSTMTSNAIIDLVNVGSCSASLTLTPIQ